MTIDREVKEGTIPQGVSEIIAYRLHIDPWGETPTGVVVKAYDITSGDRTDVTSTVLSGTATVTDNVITLPILQALTENRKYLIKVLFVVGGNTMEANINVEAEF